MAAVSARRMRGPSEMARAAGRDRISLALLHRETTFRADQQRRGSGIGGEGMSHGFSAEFVREEERAFGRPVFEQLGQSDEITKLGQGCASALFCGLDEVGTQSVEIDLVDHAALGPHRDQPRDAQFAGLSTTRSIRPFLIGAAQSQKSGTVSSGLVCWTQRKTRSRLRICSGLRPIRRLSPSKRRTASPSFTRITDIR